MTTTKKTHIMESVDFLDRISIHLFQPVPGHFNVDFSVKEKGKRLVLDEDALKKMQNKITDLCSDKNANDENTRGYIEEYVGRLLKEYYKVGLALIEDMPEARDDHYDHLRRLN